MASPSNGLKPPPGYKMEVNPPPGYVLENDFSSVPEFIKQGVDMSKVKQVVKAPETEQDRNSIAEVDSFEPYKVKVLAPDQYGPSDLNHELTHTYQDTRAKGINPAVPVKSFDRGNYDYGGIEGLKKALASGKTVSDFNYEQQADMVQDYKTQHDQYLKKAANGTITPADERRMYELQQAYHPFIKQMAEMPGKDADLKRNSLLELLGIQKPVELKRTPEPPGLPSYDTPGLGVLPADKLMGGKSQPTGRPALQTQAEQKYGFLKNHGNVQLIETPASGRNRFGGSETWPAGEEGSPDYPRPKGLPKGIDGVEVRSKGFSPDDYAAEVFSHLDPRGKDYADKFLTSLTPKQTEWLKKEALDYGHPKTPEEEKHAMKIASQAALRGYVFGQWPASAFTRAGLSTEQKQLLMDARKYARTGK